MEPLVIAVAFALWMTMALVFIVENPDHPVSRPIIASWEFIKACVNTALAPVVRAVRRAKAPPA